MENGGDKLDRVEAALLELQATGKARVFEPTRVDARLLLAEGAEARRSAGSARTRRWVYGASAAAIALVATTAIFVARPHAPSGPVADTGGFVDKNAGCDGSFLRCFSGPTKVVLSGCATHDYDADGDVDLVDFSAYQRGCKGPARIR